MRNRRSRRLQQGLDTVKGAAAAITPTSIATNNRYQGFADNNSGSFSASEDYDSEGTATTVESLPPVTYPRYIPAPASPSSYTGGGQTTVTVCANVRPTTSTRHTQTKKK